MRITQQCSVIAATLFATATLMAPVASQAQDKSLNVLIWGVTWQSAIEEVSKGFTDETGIEVNVVTQASSEDGITKLHAISSHPTENYWFNTTAMKTRT